MDLGLKGKVALIGGSSKGLGKACARQLVQEGAAVIICARQEETLRQTAQELKSLGADLNESELDKAFERFKDIADKKKQIFDDDLSAIVQENIEGKVPEVWSLDIFVITSGNRIQPMAKIRLSSEGKTFESAASGDGPVDACYKAIEKITHLRCQLFDYSLQSVTRGEDALGEVSLRLKTKGREISGRASSTGIIEASIKAYLQAINKIFS